MAAWKGALQLITKPFYWEKTVHGLDGTVHGIGGTVHGIDGTVHGIDGVGRQAAA